MVKKYIYPGLDFSLKCLHISHIILPSTQVSLCGCMLIASLGWYLSYIKTHSVAGVTRVRKPGSYSHPSSSPPLLPLCLNDRLLPWSAALSSWHWPRESSRRSLRDIQPCTNNRSSTLISEDTSLDFKLEKRYKHVSLWLNSKLIPTHSPHFDSVSKTLQQEVIKPFDRKLSNPPNMKLSNPPTGSYQTLIKPPNRELSNPPTGSY